MHQFLHHLKRHSLKIYRSNWQVAYALAYDLHYEKDYPKVWLAKLTPVVKFPKVETANGLTRFVIDMINWSGGYANRISSAGRVLGGKYIPSSTKKGTADIHAIIKGQHWSIEIKVGKDKMSEWQNEERERVQNAGGNYMIVRDADSFVTALEIILVDK
jgi:hypothetical protein